MLVLSLKALSRSRRVIISPLSHQCCFRTCSRQLWRKPSNLIIDRMSVCWPLLGLNVAITRSISASGYIRKGSLVKQNLSRYMYLHLSTIFFLCFSAYMLYSKASRRKYFAGYPEVREQLSWLEAAKFDELQAMKWSTNASLSNESIAKACDKVLGRAHISDSVRLFMLQFKGMALFDAGEMRQSKQCFLQSLELCNKLKKSPTDLIVLTNTLYMSLIVLSQEQDIDRGLKGLLFCATTAYSSWKSWKTLEYEQFLSNCSIALKCMAMYIRVAMNARHLEPLQDENLKAFVFEAETIMDSINKKRISGNAIFKKADNILFTYSVMINNDMIYYLLENIKKDEDPEQITQPYVARFISCRPVLRNTGLDKTERLYMDVNLAFIDELKGDYQQALDRLKHVTEKAADDDKIERLVQQRYHAVLEKRKRAEQKEKQEKESNQ